MISLDEGTVARRSVFISCGVLYLDVDRVRFAVARIRTPRLMNSMPAASSAAIIASKVRRWGLVKPRSKSVIVFWATPLFSTRSA
jgi:hypothetical protein